MGAIITFAMSSMISFGPVDLEAPIQLVGPSIRITEGVFVQDAHQPMVHFFEEGAQLPPHMEKVAVLTRSGVAGRVVRVLPSADNELRLVAERPESFDMVIPEAEGEYVEGVIGVIDDEDGMPIAFVTSDREDIVGIVVNLPDGSMEVIERDAASAMPMDISHEDMVIGVVTFNPRGGFNALMDQVKPIEVQGLIEMYQIHQGEQEPGQN